MRPDFDQGRTDRAQIRNSCILMAGGFIKQKQQKSVMHNLQNTAYIGLYFTVR